MHQGPSPSMKSLIVSSVLAAIPIGLFQGMAVLHSFSLIRFPFDPGWLTWLVALGSACVAGLFSLRMCRGLNPSASVKWGSLIGLFANFFSLLLVVIIFIICLFYTIYNISQLPPVIPGHTLGIVGGSHTSLLILFYYAILILIPLLLIRAISAVLLSVLAGLLFAWLRARFLILRQNWHNKP